MWLGYSIGQWLDVGVYMIGMTVLFAGIYLVGTIGANYLHKEELKELKNKRRKKSNNKKYFIDVA
jgi:preprotein translocase subunit SecG